MAEECLDNDYIQAYSRFFAKFARVEEQSEEELTVQMRRQEIQEKEILGEIINEAVQYLDSMNCPASLQAFLVRQVVRDMQTMCKERPKDCGFVLDNTYSPLRLSRAVTNKVNEICWGYMDNSKLGSLPPSSPYAYPQVLTAHIQNSRRTMEDRHIVLQDLNYLFNVKADSPAHYYAVFDGHRGRGAAMYCAAHLHRFLVNSDHYPTNPPRALHEAFVKTDTQYTEKFNKRASSGTTATCALVINKKLYVAWVGDSLGILVRRGAITLLVNPHRLHRRDEVERILKNGGVPLHSYGTVRVNGLLENSRSIGDAEFKPFVTGEPEISCETLNGTEDFLVIATDGLWDHVKEEDVMKLIYIEILQQPNSIRDVHEVLFERAKANGSQDNITILIVFLTPVEKIAERLKRQYQTAKTDPDDLLNNMDSNNPPNANGLYEFTTNGSFIKEAAQLVTNGEEEDERMEENHIIYDSSAKSKNEIERAEYDYTEDLGPETDVDAVDDIPPSSPNYLDDQYRYFLSNHSAKANKYEEASTKEEISEDAEDADDNSVDSEQSGNCDSVTNANFYAGEHPLLEEERKLDYGQVDLTSDVLDEPEHVDYDDSPPSPQATKPLQHALIPEADNVADTEDSEDEWNYYRVDPNQQKKSVALVDEQQTQKAEPEAVSPEPATEEDNVQPEIERDIRCESPTEEVSPEHIDTKQSNAEEEKEEEEVKEIKEIEKNETFVDQKQDPEEMDFQLNPDAEEFVPVSPQILGPRMNLGDDYLISGSPLKQVPQMDDIQLPSQTEFDEEICRRPRDVEGSEKECINGDHTQYTNYSDIVSSRQRALRMPSNLDDSEISSTRAEFGDESAASFLTASEFHRTGVSTIDDSFSSEREYDMSKDPMAMSLTPNDFEAAFEKGVDLNAVHDLTDADVDEKNGIMENENMIHSPEMQSQEDLISSELEQAVHITPLNGEEQSEPVHVSASQQLEEEESTLIDNANVEEPKPIDKLELHHENPSSEVDHEDIRSDHSPLIDHYSAEFELEKEPIVEDKSPITEDNEPPLSPSSVDIEDKTKPIDESSEDAVLPMTYSQRDDDQKDDDTPSSLSPVSDAMECTTPQKEFDLADSMKYVQISSTPIVSQLHYDTPEFKPGQYNLDDACELESAKSETHPIVSAETQEDNVQKEEQLINVEESEERVSQDIPLSHVVAEEPEEQKLLYFSDERVSQDIPISQVLAEEPEEQKLLYFSDEREVCTKSEPPKHFEAEMTPPLSPNEADNKIVDDILGIQGIQDTQGMQGILDIQGIEDTQGMQDIQGIQGIQDIQDVQTKDIQDILDIQESCPTLSDLVDADVNVPKIEETVMKTDVCEVQAPKETSYPIEFESEVHQGSTGMNLSESMQEFTGLEKQLVPEQFSPQESKPIEVIEPELVKEEEMKPVEEEKEPEPEIPVQEIKEVEIVAPVVPESAEFEIKKEEVEILQKPIIDEPTISTTVPIEAAAIAAPIDDAVAEATTAPVADITTAPILETAPAPIVDAMATPIVDATAAPIVDATPAPIVDATPAPIVNATPDATVAATATTAAVATAVTAVAAAATASAVSKPKTKLASKPTKTTTTKATSKTTPLSPSKAPSATSRLSTSGPAKKPIASTTARPKEADAVKKSATAATSKVPASKPAAAAKSIASTTATRTATTRTSTSAPKPRTTTTSLKSASGTADKKPTLNGDVKPLSKLAAPKTASKPPTTTSTTAAKSSLVKSATATRTTTSVAAPRPRPASATTQTKTTTTAKSSASSTSTTAATTRPKTAPNASAVAKSRVSSTVKSPMIDKQIKETANKQISLARTSTSTVSKTSSRTSTSVTSSTSTAIKRTSTSKTATAGSSPTKKTTATTKITGRVSNGTKTSTGTSKTKVVQNGMSEITEISSTTIISANNKIEDDIPIKDLSPVVVPTDNQLITSSD